jgi:XTP/dITP diphosphohydrolase
VTGLGRVVLATRNQGKVAEFTRLMEGALCLEAVPAWVSMPEETGSSFVENARLKAESVYAALRRDTAVLADDSGLEVAALGGSPGVFSARYAGEGATDEQNVQKLLTQLQGHSDRSARFVCALHLILPPDPSRDARLPVVVEVQGVVSGTIVRAPRGAAGFGYDPVFLPLGETETLAEASPIEKDRLSHRGAAVAALLGRLSHEAVLLKTPPCCGY